jgi:hypothetical protein
MTRPEILELIKTTVDETFPSTPLASSFINWTTDLLVDIPMFMVEDFDGFLTALEEKMGAGWGELVGPETLDNLQYLSKVENIIKEIEDFLLILDDEDLVLFEDELKPTVLSEDVVTENFYSFESELFKSTISHINSQDFPVVDPQIRIVEHCVGANTAAAHLLQQFLGFNYFAEEMKEPELIYGALSVLINMHHVLSEFEEDKLFAASGTPPGIVLEFDNPVTVKYLHDLEGASQMLSVVVAKLLEKTSSDLSERQQTDIKDVIKEIEMIFCICNDVIAYAGGNFNSVIKKIRSIS